MFDVRESADERKIFYSRSCPLKSWEETANSSKLADYDNKALRNSFLKAITLPGLSFCASQVAIVLLLMILQCKSRATNLGVLACIAQGLINDKVRYATFLRHEDLQFPKNR